MLDTNVGFRYHLRKTLDTGAEAIVMQIGVTEQPRALQAAEYPCADM